MTTRQMTEAQISRFWRAMDEQGVEVTRTKKGLMLRLPDGTSTVKHFTESDVKAPINLMARLRRAGVVHPDDPRGPLKLPSYITSPTPKQATLKKARAIIEEMGFPERVATVDLAAAFGPTDAPRMLYFLGYTPSVVKGRKGTRLWDAPEELDARFMGKKPVEQEADITDMQEWVDRAAQMQKEVDEGIEEQIEAAIERHPAGNQIEPAEEPEPPIDPVEAVAEHIVAVKGIEPAHTPHTEAYLMNFAERARRAQEAINELGVGPDSEPVAPDVPRETFPEVRQESNGREYIDTADSWSVDMRELLGEHLNRMVTDRLAVLTAVGIEYEVRVWRKRK